MKLKCQITCKSEWDLCVAMNHSGWQVNSSASLIGKKRKMARWRNNPDYSKRNNVSRSRHILVIITQTCSEMVTNLIALCNKFLMYVAVLQSEVQDLRVMSKQSEKEKLEMKQNRDTCKLERDNLESQVGWELAILLSSPPYTTSFTCLNWLQIIYLGGNFKILRCNPKLYEQTQYISL